MLVVVMWCLLGTSVRGSDVVFMVNLMLVEVMCLLTLSFGSDVVFIGNLMLVVVMWCLLETSS